MIGSFVSDPFLWPFVNIFRATSYNKGSKKIGKEIKPVSKPHPESYLIDFKEHFTACVAAVRAWLMAYAVVYYLSPKVQPSGVYPAFDGVATTFELSWMLPIFIRNLVATWIIAGGWDYLLYFSPLAESFKPFKLNAVYPDFSQFKHDAFWTTSATLTASALEALICYGYCNNYFPAYMNLEFNFFNIFMIMAVTHIRIPHFYVIHRLMHPWKTEVIPDIGKFLYKHVHSLHHKSYNPTAFSGTSMHPVESTLYYSAALVLIPLKCHPTIVLSTIIDCGVGAWLGHDGFQSPGTCDFFHYLHHAHFDCNYGAPHVPLDWLFGTAICAKEDLKLIWKKKKKTNSEKQK